MKTIVRLVIVSFLVAVIPRPVYADHRGASPAALGIAFGAVALIITVLTLGTSRDRGKAIEAKKEVDIEHIKASAASGAKVSCGDEPCENGYYSDTAGSAVVRHMPIAQPIAQNARSQNVRPLVSHKNGSGGESALCRAGREAALSGIPAACEPNDATDYCRCYQAAKEGR